MTNGRYRPASVWLAGEQEGVSEDGFLSWSNVRKGKPRAAEYHLYYSGNAVTEAMQPGDTMFLARRPDGSVLVVVAPAGSTVDLQMRWLFGIEEQGELREEYKDIEHDRQAELDFAARYVLDELGIEIEEPEVDVIDDLLKPFGMTFPTTAVFSALARKSRCRASIHVTAPTQRSWRGWSVRRPCSAA